MGPPYFEDVTLSSNINHTYHNGEESGYLSILESLGGGAGVIDFDRSGLLSVILPGGGHYGGKDNKEILGNPNKLYKNLGNFKFKDVSVETGIDKVRFYNHGVAVADYDNDGWPDILLTGWGRLALLHNEPDGKGGRHFVDVTQKAGLNSTLWSSSAGWADFDGDGHVDLYVADYVNWSFANDPHAYYDGQSRDVAPPKYFKALPDVLYRNNGDGTFTDVSKSAGLRGPRQPEDYPPLKKDYKEEARARYLKAGRPPSEAENEAEAAAEAACERLRQADDPKDPAYGKGLGVLIVDVNLDGKPDIFVANDTVPKFLYVNRSRPGKILFEEMGMEAGVAMDDRGSPNGSMGLAAGDPLGTGRPSLMVCNYESEMYGLYLNECKDDQVIFRFGTQTIGLGAIGQVFVSWGTQFVDFDLDGWEDIVISSGHAIRFPGGKNKGPRAANAPRRQLPLLLLNQANPTNGSRRFKEMNRRRRRVFCDSSSGSGGGLCRPEQRWPGGHGHGQHERTNGGPEERRRRRQSLAGSGTEAAGQPRCSGVAHHFGSRRPQTDAFCHGRRQLCLGLRPASGLWPGHLRQGRSRYGDLAQRSQANLGRPGLRSLPRLDRGRNRSSFAGKW